MLEEEQERAQNVEERAQGEPEAAAAPAGSSSATTTGTGGDFKAGITDPYRRVGKKNLSNQQWVRVPQARKTTEGKTGWVGILIYFLPVIFFYFYISNIIYI